MKQSKFKEYRAIFRNEFGLAVCTGSIPMLLVMLAQPTLNYSMYLKNMNPSNPVLYYSLFLFVLHLAFTGLCGLFLSGSIESRTRLDAICHFTSQLSSGIIGIYRAASGALLAGIGILIFDTGFVEGWHIVTGFTVVFAFVMVVLCVFMQRTIDLITPKRLKRVNY